MERQSFARTEAQSFGLNKHVLKKSEILRQRDLFKQIALTGTRLDGTVLRCKYVMHIQGDPQVQIGFKVPSAGSSTRLHAVRRNRIRRQMREAFSAELPALRSALNSAQARVGIILTYRKAKDNSVERMSFSQIQHDVRMFCRLIAVSIQENTR